MSINYFFVFLSKLNLAYIVQRIFHDASFFTRPSCSVIWKRDFFQRGWNLAIFRRLKTRSSVWRTLFDNKPKKAVPLKNKNERYSDYLRCLSWKKVCIKYLNNYIYLYDYELSKYIKLIVEVESQTFLSKIWSKTWENDIFHIDDALSDNNSKILRFLFFSCRDRSVKIVLRRWCYLFSSHKIHHLPAY